MASHNQYMVTSDRSDGATNTIYVSAEVFATLRRFALHAYREVIEGPHELHVLTLSEGDLKLAYNEE